MTNDEMMEMNEMIATKKEQMNEAKRRMQKLGINADALLLYENGSLVVYERCSIIKNIFVVQSSELPPEIYKKVNDIEETYGIEVYAVIKTNTEFGLLYDCLYVPKHMEEWVDDDVMLDDGYVMSYCINTDIPEFSEFGGIGVGNVNGNLYRAD